MWTVPEDILAARKDNSRAVALVTVPQWVTCEHSFGIFVSKTFNLVGYKRDHRMVTSTSLQRSTNETAARTTLVGAWKSTIGTQASVHTSGPAVAAPNTQRVTCPLCLASVMWTVPEDTIAARKDNSRAVALVTVPQGVTCEHSFGIFVSKTFNLVGYKN
jgi:hypothetical protein